MSRPGDKRLGRQKAQDRPSDRLRGSDTGLARGPGIVVTVVTAAIVFVIGQRLFPIPARQSPPQPGPTVAVSPAPVTPRPAVIDAAAQAPTSGADGGTPVDASAAATADAAPERSEKAEKAEKPNTAEPSKPAADSEAGDATADHKPSEKQDKD